VGVQMIDRGKSFRDLSSIHNYFERPAREELLENYANVLDEDTIEDVFCYALNMLPAKYIRHDVDMSFFLTAEQRIHLLNMVKFAVFLSYIKISADEFNLFELTDNTPLPVIIIDYKQDLLLVNCVLKSMLGLENYTACDLEQVVDNDFFHAQHHCYGASSTSDLSATDYSIANRISKVSMMNCCFDAVSIRVFPERSVFLTLLSPAL
jgi:hypothetical protein